MESIAHTKAIYYPYMGHSLCHTISILGPYMAHITGFGKGNFVFFFSFFKFSLEFQVANLESYCNNSQGYQPEGVII